MPLTVGMILALAFPGLLLAAESALICGPQETYTMLRQRPDKNSTGLLRLDCNSHVSVIDSESGWTKVQTIQGIEGYIMTASLASASPRPKLPAQKESSAPIQPINPCDLKSVFVGGNNVAANVARDEIGSDTWLKLVSRPNDADLILDVAESQQVTTVLYTQIQITVRIQLKRPPTGDDELLWSGSESERIGGFGSATGKLLQRMTKELGCKK